ncbi:AAA family ATPase [Streptomyces sp. NPDC017936]|uniref:AAA family ATPase n=1 Tax=Streptomyces sp. NPDC017936 TaxID=3365016 RepID=UPI0037993318
MTSSPSDERPRTPVAPDRPDGSAYVVRGDLDLAVEVALATGRPLLLRGDPGSGKSSFAAHVAGVRRWAYHEHVVTSRTQAQDLLWSFDHVRRLADAQAQQLRFIGSYVEPGALWKAYAPRAAREHVRRAHGDTLWDDGAGQADDAARRSVVLIDEIDKADPDLPNGLLVPLGARRFTVAQTGQRVEPEDGTEALVVITTNEQRELPEAFLRRCLVVALEHPGREELVAIAREHVVAYDGEFTAADRALAGTLADQLEDLRQEAARSAHRRPSTAEFLDAFHACRSLGIGIGDPRWKALSAMALSKRDTVQ